MAKDKKRNNNLLENVNIKANQLLKEIIIERKDQTNDEVSKEIERLMQQTDFIYERIGKNKEEIGHYTDFIQEILDKVAHYFSYIDNVYQEEIIPDNILSKIEILKNKHKHLEILFYNFKLDKISKKMSDVQDEVNVQVEKFISEHQKIEELERRNQELMNQFGSMTANLITLIITFTIVTTALSAMEKFKDFNYLSLFVVSLVFLGVSAVIVSSSTLNSKKSLPKIVFAIWIVLFIIFIVVMIISLIGIGSR